MLKKILLGLLVVVVLLIGVAYLLPRRITVTHTAQLASSPDVLFPLVATPMEWPQWSPWNKRDPDMTITFSGPPTGVGARWDWKSASQGDGFMVFTESMPSVRIGYNLTIIGMGPPSTGTFRFAPNPSGTMVEWSMTADMGNNPLGRWFGLLMPNMLRKDFVEGLAGLDEYAKTQPPSEPIMGIELPGAVLVPRDSGRP